MLDGLDKLNALGKFTLTLIKDNPELIIKHKPLKLDKEILRRAYKEVEMEEPDWVTMIYEEEDVEDEVLDVWRTILKQYIMS